MSDLSPPPRRWRRVAASAPHAETIRDILDTPPIIARSDGLVLFAEIGSAQLLPCLVAVKSLHARLGRGRVALLDNGTLTGADRALLAHHCGDPEIIALSGAKDPALPDTPAWNALGTVFKRRISEYWLWVSSASVTIGPVPEIERAIALNASFLLPAEGAFDAPRPLTDLSRLAYPDASDERVGAARLESRLGEIARPDWRYVRSDAAIMGFAAGGPGLSFAAACRAGLERLVGAEGLSKPETARVAASIALASESRTVILPRNSYRPVGAAGRDAETSFVGFEADGRQLLDRGYAEASRIAIASLHGG